MSIEAPQGILNIPNATLRVGKLAVNELLGVDTVINTIARNTILLVDGETYHENKNWDLKLPNAWAGEFECNTASAGNYSEFNFYNEGASSNAQGYNLTFNDTAVQLRYDGTLLKTGTLASTITGTGVKKVRLMFERTILSVTVDGTLIFTHDDTGGPRPRVYSTTAGGFLNFFTDGGALKNLKIVNEKWISDGTSNIAYVGGGEVSITGSLDVASNVTAANSKFSLDTNGTFKQDGVGDSSKYIKMTKYIAAHSNMRIAQGSYSGNAYQWVSVRAKFTRLNQHTQTIQFDYLGTSGGSSVKNSIVIGDLPGASQANEVVVYNKTGDSTYEIYLQIDSATTISVEVHHKDSNIDESYATLTGGAIDETGLTMVYNSGTYADFSLRDKNVIISDDTIYSGLYNYGDTQSIFIDRGVSGGAAGTVTADTTYNPPPGVVGDVVCKFQNNVGGEAVTNSFLPPGLTCSTGDVFTFGVWALATQNISMEFFVNPAGPGGVGVGWQVIGDGNWRFYQNSATVNSGASNTTAFFRIDNNTGSSVVYLTGATIRKNPVAPTNTLLPYTPRYSPISGEGTVLATRNLIAKEAAIKTLTGNVGFGTKDPGAPIEAQNVHGSAIARFGVKFLDTSTNADGVLNILGISGSAGAETLALQTQIDGRSFATDNANWASGYGNQDRYDLVLQPYKGYVGIGSTNPYSKFDTYGGGITQRHTGDITPWGGTITSAANAGLVLAQTGYAITGSGAKYWQLAMWSNNNLHISNRGFSTAYITGNVTGGSLNFTGQHRTFIKDVSFTQAIDLEGLIVSADQNKYIKMSGGIEAGSNAITTNESLPIVSISTKVNDKKCFGVISTSEDPESREDAYGRFVSIIPKENGDTRVYINSVGEGALWVTNINGSLESGDYITTSNVAGYGQKQDGAGLMNYTVAKITMDCDFEPVTQPIQVIKKELQDVDNWFKMRYDTITEAEFSNCTSESRRTVTETMYTDENGEINTEQYNSLEPDVQSTYTELTKTIYQSVERESFKTEKEGYEYEVRSELVNVLDEHGQIRWEDHPTETEPAYKIRYLDANGNITDEANAVHKAAFVGCTYHCG